MIEAAERSIFIGDVHVPHQDERAIGAMLALLTDLKPQHGFLNGDIMDCGPLSRFEQRPKDRLRLQNDRRELDKFLYRLVLASPATRWRWMEGNHERRLSRYLSSRAPELYDAPSLQPREFFHCKRFRIEWVPQERTYVHNGFIVTHGDIVRSRSAYTARGNLDRYGTSGISNHTHRLGSHFRSDFSGGMVWYENGCLCKLDPEYVVGRPDWQQGFSVGWFVEDRFQVEQVWIDGKGRALYGGRVYSG